MSRSNFDKPFYVDVGTSCIAIRCASNHDVIRTFCLIALPHTLELAKEICDRMNKEAEIGRPPRNCDVGTAAEQSERYKKFCYAYRSREKRCGDCPLCDTPCCDFAWLQMPYEEGGAK